MDEWEQVGERVASADLAEIGYLAEDLDRLRWLGRKPRRPGRRHRATW